MCNRVNYTGVITNRLHVHVPDFGQVIASVPLIAWWKNSHLWPLLFRWTFLLRVESGYPVGLPRYLNLAARRNRWQMDYDRRSCIVQDSEREARCFLNGEERVDQPGLFFCCNNGWPLNISIFKWFHGNSLPHSIHTTIFSKTNISESCVNLWRCVSLFYVLDLVLAASFLST